MRFIFISLTAMWVSGCSESKPEQPDQPAQLAQTPGCRSISTVFEDEAGALADAVAIKGAPRMISSWAFLALYEALPSSTRVDSVRKALEKFTKAQRYIIQLEEDLRSESLDSFSHALTLGLKDALESRDASRIDRALQETTDFIHRASGNPNRSSREFQSMCVETQWVDSVMYLAELGLSRKGTKSKPDTVDVTRIPGMWYVFTEQERESAMKSVLEEIITKRELKEWIVTNYKNSTDRDVLRLIEALKQANSGSRIDDVLLERALIVMDKCVTLIGMKLREEHGYFVRQP